MARDLHDVLGHNLSLIAVRLQVVEHLIRDQAASAADEVREVRDLTLSSLRDVRDTVAGYRVPAIDAELAGAGIALAGAGIALDTVDARDEVLPADVDAGLRLDRARGDDEHPAPQPRQELLDHAGGGA